MKTMIHRISGRAAALMTALLVIVLVSASFTMQTFAASPEEQADRILAGMSTDQKIAQMMVVAMPKPQASFFLWLPFPLLMPMSMNEPMIASRTDIAEVIAAIATSA